MANVVVTYGNGDSKKGSVRMKPLSASHNIKVDDLGDIYVSREILKSLDIKDNGTIEVSFSNPDSPL